MAEIIRKTGNVQPFAINATGTNRTVYGDVTQSDTLDANVTADYLTGWEIVGVNDAPTKQDFNALGFTLSQFISYLHQKGVPEWDSAQEYYAAKSFVNYAGTLYVALTDNTNKQPDTFIGVDWQSAGGGINEVVDDTTPQLGGDLDANAFNIKFDDATGLLDANGNEQLIFQLVASAVNHFEVTNSATGASPLLKAVGSDANVDMRIASQGSSGDVRIESASGITEFVATAATQSEIRLFEDTDNGSNYIGIKPPAAVTSSTTFVLPDGDGAANARLYTDGSGNLNWASTGAFEARAGGAQSVSHATLTKIQFPSEVFDAQGWYDNATNYRYTPLEAGKYLVIAIVQYDSVVSQKFNQTFTYIQKNGSPYAASKSQEGNAGGGAHTLGSVIVDMNGSTDYIEIYSYHQNSNSGSRTINAGSYFQAIRIG